ncbi:hypothetical protein SAMN04489757_1501, partial [Anaerocolumna aminovalerica]
LKRHHGRAVVGVLVATGRAKLGVTAKRNEFKFTTMGTAVHGTAKGRIAAVNHLFNVFHNNMARMKRIFNYFIIVIENLL